MRNPSVRPFQDFRYMIYNYLFFFTHELILLSEVLSFGGKKEKGFHALERAEDFDPYLYIFFLQ